MSFKKKNDAYKALNIGEDRVDENAKEKIKDDITTIFGSIVSLNTDDPNYNYYDCYNNNNKSLYDTKFTTLYIDWLNSNKK